MSQSCTPKLIGTWGKCFLSVHEYLSPIMEKTCPDKFHSKEVATAADPCLPITSSVCLSSLHRSDTIYCLGKDMAVALLTIPSCFTDKMAQKGTRLQNCVTISSIAPHRHSLSGLSYTVKSFDWQLSPSGRRFSPNLWDYRYFWFITELTTWWWWLLYWFFYCPKLAWCHSSVTFRAPDYCRGAYLPSLYSGEAYQMVSGVWSQPSDFYFSSHNSWIFLPLPDFFKMYFWRFQTFVELGMQLS